MEMVQLAELAKDKVYEFCFMGFHNPPKMLPFLADRLMKL